MKWTSRWISLNSCVCVCDPVLVFNGRWRCQGSYILDNTWQQMLMLCYRLTSEDLRHNRSPLAFGILTDGEMGKGAYYIVMKSTNGVCGSDFCLGMLKWSWRPSAVDLGTSVPRTFSPGMRSASFDPHVPRSLEATTKRARNMELQQEIKVWLLQSGRRIRIIRPKSVQHSKKKQNEITFFYCCSCTKIIFPFKSGQ